MFRHFAPWVLAVACTACGSVQPVSPPPEAVRSYTEAGLLSQSGRHADAADAYDRATELDPQSLEVWLAAARARERLGQWDAVISRAERAQQVAPGDHRPMGLLARAFLARGELGEARARYAQLTERHPDKAEHWRELGAVAELQDDTDAAERAYLEATKRDPDDAKAWVRLGTLRRRMNRPAAAAAAYAEAVRRDTSKADLDPQILALALEGGDREQARAAASRMAGAAAQPGAGSLAVATILLKKNDLLSAANELEWLLEEQPEHVQGRLLMGHILAKVKRWEEARAHLDRVPIAGPHGPEALRLLGHIALARDEGDVAIELLKQARVRRPERPEFVVDHARALRTLGRHEEALTLLTQGINRWPRNADLRFVRAMTMHDSGDEDGALWAMHEILDVDRRHAGALNYIGFTWADAGEKLDEAERLIRRALKVQPENPSIVDSLGWVLYRKGDLAEARRALDRAVSLDPESAEIRFHLACVLRAQGEGTEAEVTFAEALERATPDEAEQFQERWKQPAPEPKKGPDS